MAKSSTILILTLAATEDAERVKRAILEIEHVMTVEFNHITRKLLVRFEAEEDRLAQVEEEIRKAIGRSGPGRRYPPQGPR